MKNEAVELLHFSSSQFPSNAVFKRVHNNGGKTAIMLENHEVQVMCGLENQ